MPPLPHEALRNQGEDVRACECRHLPASVLADLLLDFLTELGRIELWVQLVQTRPQPRPRLVHALPQAHVPVVQGVHVGVLALGQVIQALVEPLADFKETIPRGLYWAERVVGEQLELVVGLDESALNLGISMRDAQSVRPAGSIWSICSNCKG